MKPFLLLMVTNWAILTNLIVKLVIDLIGLTGWSSLENGFRPQSTFHFQIIRVFEGEKKN